jgi:hypothetical protein
MTISQTQDTVGETGHEIDLVQAAKDRDAVLSRDVAQQRQHRYRRRRIKAGDWFVGQDQRTFLHQHTRDGDPLLLTAGELIGATGGEIQQLNPVERGERALAVGPAKTARRRSPQRDMPEPPRQRIVER